MKCHCLFFCAVLCFQLINGQSQCRTPLGGAGTCKLLDKCQLLKEFEQNPKKTETDLLFLRQSTCGLSHNFKPKVCCPPESEWQSIKPIPVVFPHPKPAPVIPVKGDDVSDADREYAESFNCPSTLVAPAPDSGCCGVESIGGDKISGGDVANVEEYPWLALLEYSGRFTACGGTLISSRYVLTAAHCIGDTMYGEAKRVRLGEYNTTSYPTDTVEVNGGGFEILEVVLISIEKQLPHPDFKGRSGNRFHDIGLVKLSKNAPYTDFIRPICLPTKDVVINPTQSLRFFTAGWGSNGTDFSDVKQHVALPYVPQNVCQIPYKNRLHENQLCAGGEEGKDSCKGDSGGPLMMYADERYELVGVVSYGHTHCGTKDFPGVYTNVYRYLDWLKREMI